MSTFDSAKPAPRGLLYLASFNSAERSAIAASSGLRDAIGRSEPAEWPSILDQHRAAEREGQTRKDARSPPPHAGGAEHVRQQRYAASILDRDLSALATMQPGSGRNDRAFRLVCRIGRWVHAGIIGRDRLIADVLDACERNGLVQEDGRKTVLDTIESGLARSSADTLPELEGRHG